MENYQAQVGKWQEVSEARYMEMLEILPPIFYAGGFFMQEPLHADLHDFFIKVGGKFTLLCCLLIARLNRLRNLWKLF